MRPRIHHLVLIFLAGILVAGLATGGAVLLTKREEQPPGAVQKTHVMSEADREGARQAAVVAAEYTTNRKEAILPLFDDSSAAVPVYPPGTRIEVEQQTWRRIGESAGVYAGIAPQGKRVMLHFTRTNGRWYITQIEPKP